MNIPIDVNKSNSLAIIILNWNGSDDTVGCTRSVLRADHNPDDIFIVAGSSLNVYPAAGLVHVAPVCVIVVVILRVL